MGRIWQKGKGYACLEFFIEKNKQNKHVIGIFNSIAKPVVVKENGCLFYMLIKYCNLFTICDDQVKITI